MAGAFESTMEMVPWSKQEKSTSGFGQSVGSQSLESHITRLKTVAGKQNA